MQPEKIKRYSMVIFVLTILAGYSTFAVGEYQISSSTSRTANPFLNPYEARSYPDKLEIFQGDKKVSLMHSEKPNIERWGFIDSGNMVVVKSKSEDGSVIYELFDTATGKRKDKAASSVNNGHLPRWAADFIE